MLRWAAQLATEGGIRGALGVRMLEALGESELLQPHDEPLVSDALDLVANAWHEGAMPSTEDEMAWGYTEEQEVRHDDNDA